MVVGDVVGRGVQAASLMAQIRTALRAYAFEGHTAVQVGRPRQRAADVPAAGHDDDRRLPRARPGDGAAHGRVRRPPAAAGDRALGTRPVPGLADRRRAGGHARRAVRARGSATSRRARRSCSTPTGWSRSAASRSTWGWSGCGRWPSAASRRSSAFCTAAVDELIASGRPADDVALLAVRALPLGDRLETSWPAHSDALAGLRHLLRRWLRHHGADDNEIYDITVSCQEAAANAVEHAYAPGTRTFEVDAAVEEGAVTLTVRDHGQWRSARGRHRGRGLPIMEALMDSVEVEQNDHGTVVVMRRTLGGPGMNSIARRRGDVARRRAGGVRVRRDRRVQRARHRRAAACAADQPSVVDGDRPVRGHLPGQRRAQRAVRPGRAAARPPAAAAPSWSATAPRSTA